MSRTTDRTNDLYCRDMPSAKAIEEIKHLAAVRKVKVGKIVHGEHQVVKWLREMIVANDGPVPVPATEIADLLKRHGVHPI